MVRRRITDAGYPLRPALALVCLLGCARCGRSELYALDRSEPPAPDAAAPVEDAAAGEDVEAPVDAHAEAHAIVDGPADVGAVDAGIGADASDGAAEACPAGGCVLVFDSGRDWRSWSGEVQTSPPSFTLLQSLGAAVDVCLNSGDPPSCPSDALLYGYALLPATVWTGGTSIPNARWIWRADVMPSQPAANQVAIFQKSFVVGAGATGSLVIAVDDLAVVFVNGAVAGTVGSVTDVNVAGAAHTVATTMSLTPVLKAGSNLITIACENGPFGNGPDRYMNNPAGVVFEGTLRW